MRFILAQCLILLTSPLLIGQDGSLIANTKTSGQNVSIDAPFTGLWEVTKVTVGQEVLTPHAKWFELRSDGTSFSGNGWLQNSAGTWEFNELNKEILFSAEGIPDEFGGFVLSYDGTQMTWTRMEDGRQVVVELRRTKEKPKALWDKIVGTWKTSGVGPNPREIRFSWTKRFVDADFKVQLFGIWHIDAHKPELTLFYAREERDVWKIQIDGDQMTWEHANDMTRKLVFTRKKESDNQ